MPGVISLQLGNWGIHVLRKLEYFYNHALYCDLTLQFHNNEQLKVHRLVLNASTDYFAQLERTCQMCDGCLIMPDDVQADVIIPIINYMYTGELKWPMVIHDKLRASTVMLDMPMLTYLLDKAKLNAQEMVNSSNQAGLQSVQSQGTQTYQMQLQPTESLKVVEPPVEISNEHSIAKAFETTADDKENIEPCAEPKRKRSKVIATTEVVQEMDPLSLYLSDESQDANDNTNNKNDEAMPQELLSQNESQPSVTLNPKVLISSLLNDWDDSQEGGLTVVNTVSQVSVPEVNSVSQDKSSTISEDEIMENTTAAPKDNVSGTESVIQ